MSKGWRIQEKHEGNAPLKSYGKTTTSFTFFVFGFSDYCVNQWCFG